MAPKKLSASQLESHSPTEIVYINNNTKTNEQLLVTNSNLQYELAKTVSCVFDVITPVYIWWQSHHDLIATNYKSKGDAVRKKTEPTKWILNCSLFSSFSWYLFPLLNQRNTSFVIQVRVHFIFIFLTNWFAIVYLFTLGIFPLWDDLMIAKLKTQFKFQVFLIDCRYFMRKQFSVPETLRF